jgi:hypothetical protein
MILALPVPRFASGLALQDRTNLELVAQEAVSILMDRLHSRIARDAAAMRIMERLLAVSRQRPSEQETE